MTKAIVAISFSGHGDRVDRDAVQNAPDKLDGRETISARELREGIYGNRWAIFGFILCSTLVAGWISWMRPKMYTASVEMAVARHTGGKSELGALASQIGGLGSGNGLSLSSGGTRKWESIAILESETLTQEFIQRQNLLPVLYPNKWDASKQQWKSLSPMEVPTLWEAYRYFNGKIRSVAVDPKTGLVTLTIYWRNPREAAAWANDLVGMANDYLRNRAIQESMREIAYLKGEAKRTTSVEVRHAIFEVLTAQINRAVLAQGERQYAFKILDRAFAPELPTSLPFWLWMVIVAFLSSVTSVLAVFLSIAWRKN